MAYTPLFQTTDTIAATASLLSGATSTTLTSGNFGSPTGVQLYVVDYDIPGSAEIISATVAGTAMTSITRGLAGGAASTTNHTAGAKVGSLWVPQFLANGMGAIASLDGWSTWAPVYTGYSVAPTPSAARYFQLGKIVIATLEHSAYGTSNGTSLTLTLPVAAKTAQTLVGGRVRDNGGYSSTIGTVVTTAGSATATAFRDMTGTAWTNTNGKGLDFTVIYEAN